MTKHVGLRLVPKYPNCPSCGKELRAFSSVSPRPAPGNLSICDQCLGLNIFISAETLEQRVATDAEVEEHIQALKEQNDPGMVALIEYCLTRRRRAPRA